MSAVWALDLPSSEKFVLLALADNANDDGTCWPSVATICSKTSLAERTVRKVIHTLQQLGQLVISERYGRSNVFTVTPACSAPLQDMHPAPDAPSPLHQEQGTPAPRAPTPAPRAPRIIKEPSTEPSVESSNRRDEWFLDFKLAYPDRAGDQGWRGALKASHARISEGHTAEEMVDGARRYAVHIRSMGNEGTQYVKKAATFLGPDKHFLQPWEPVRNKTEKQVDSNISVSQQWLRDTEMADATH